MTQDPDYIAGRYKSVEDYQKWMDPSAETLAAESGTTTYFDVEKGEFVLPGQQTPGAVWNETLHLYSGGEAQRAIDAADAEAERLPPPPPQRLPPLSP